MIARVQLLRTVRREAGQATVKRVLHRSDSSGRSGGTHWIDMDRRVDDQPSQMHAANGVLTGKQQR